MLQYHFSYEAIDNVIDLESFKIRIKVIGKTKATIISKEVTIQFLCMHACNIWRKLQIEV